MPPLGAEARAEQRATLNRIAHERSTRARARRAARGAAPVRGESTSRESFEASVVRVARRDYEKGAASRASCAPR